MLPAVPSFDSFKLILLQNKVPVGISKSGALAVDVLQIIKSDHDRVRLLLSQLEVANSETRLPLFEKLSNDLRLHSKIEESYLYPEISSLASEKYPGFFDFCVANHRTIVRTLSTMQKSLMSEDLESFSKYLQSLNKVVLAHFSAEEDNLMPLLRRFVPTAEREELGIVFQDLSQTADLLADESSKATRKRSRA